MSSSTVYLDWNATAPLRPEVVEAMAASLRLCGNPSSIHRAGRAARRRLEIARAQVATFVDVAPSEVVFTSGGTEANRLALQGVAGRRLLLSAIEHDSVRHAGSGGEIIPVTRDGVVDIGALEQMLAADQRQALVTLMLANNETGVIQPVAEAARIAHAHGALMHCDAVQAAGKIPFTRRQLGADMLTVSAHKLGGPPGVGALIIGADVPFPATRSGGGQERGRRAGTENLPGVVGFGTACSVAANGLGDDVAVAALRDQAERRLLTIAPEIQIHGRNAPRLANTLCVSMPGVASAIQVMALDLAGVMVSAGAACSSGKVKRSHVLDAMGVSAADAECAIRISLGWSTTEADINRLAEAWGALYSRNRANAA